MMGCRHLQVQSVDQSEINAHYARAGHKTLDDGGQAAQMRPNRTAVAVRFGVKQNKGGRGEG